MSLLCNVCRERLDKPFYESPPGRSLTSLGTIRADTTRVYACSSCGHVQSNTIRDIDHFYANEYDILTDSAEEDQIYEINSGVPTFRTTHQLKVLLSKIEIGSDARILDFGCAKSSTMRALRERRPDLAVHLFDVSERYIPYWRTFLNEDRFALRTLPSSWMNHFDVITSFFSLEHVLDPVDTMNRMGTLLKPGGICYVIVPNFLTNAADVIVADHANHFTVPSLFKLLEEVGMYADEVDVSSHRGAFVVVARRSDSKRLARPSPAETPPEAIARAVEIGRFWTSSAERVREFEKRTRNQGRLAIYGAGFYGSFIASCLLSSERVACFLDQNPFLHGKQVNGTPVLTPEKLPADVSSLLVGLNPTAARKIISDISALANRNLEYLYL